MAGRVLTVAGSDSSGGAGIQADIKTVTALGGYAACAITALTAQDTNSVYDIVPVDPDFVGLQMRVVLQDLGVDAIKTGMLYSGDVVRCVAELIGRYAKGVDLVLDPVLVSSSGRDLFQEQDLSILKKNLLPLAAVVSPNLAEARALTGLDVNDEQQMTDAAMALVDMGAKAALVTGGHLPGPDMVDVLVWEGGVEKFRSTRVQTKNTHGTGCTLSSAIATGLAFGLNLPTAVEKARQYLLMAIKRAPGYGSGQGPVNHALPGMSLRASEGDS